MRVLTLFLVFAVGVYVMARVVFSIPAASCQPGPRCEAPVGASDGPVSRPGLQVVLYDPGVDPRPAEGTLSPYFPGWVSSEGGTPAEAPQDPASTPPREPRLFEVVRLTRPDARGACLIVNETDIRCIGLFKPKDENLAAILH